MSVDPAITADAAAAATASLQALTEAIQLGSIHKLVLPSFWVEDLVAVLWSRSGSRKELTLLAGAGI
jgi:hypothetical protein